MTFSIRQFRSELAARNGGYLKNEHFNMSIAVPSILQGAQMTNQQRTISVGNMPAAISLRATEVRTPSLMVKWVDVLRYGHGLQQSQPFNGEVTNMFCEIICDRHGDLYNFFHTWLCAVFAFSPLNDSQGGGQVNQSRPSYLLNYKDEYATTVNVKMYDIVGNLALDFVLNMAFPVTIREIPLDWERTRDLVTLNVLFEYRDYSVTTLNLGQGQYNTNLTSPVSASNPSQAILINS